MQLEKWGWSPCYAEACARSPYEPARVTAESRGIFTVQRETGPAQATVAGRAGNPVTGDWVLLDDTGQIAQLLPRRTCLSRKKSGRSWDEQALAANIDVLFIVTALDGDFNPRRLERYLLLAAESRAQPVIVINKADLVEDPWPFVEQADRLTHALTPVVLLSAFDSASVTKLHAHVEPKQTAALLGSSGVGKSTLTNALLGREQQSTCAVREHDHRGRHTTTARQLFLLDQGWLLMDTPGIRELQPWVSEGALDDVFSDIAGLAANCRFRDCRHADEPGCAVRDQIDAQRLASFNKLKAEQAYQLRMHDTNAQLELKRKWKAIHKAARKLYKQR